MFGNQYNKNLFLMKRRTEKDKEEILVLKEKVINLIKKYHISAYELDSKIENITFPTVLNIMNGTTVYPNKGKLQSVINYINKNYEKINTNEDEKDIFKNIDNEKLDKLLSEVKNLKQIIDKGFNDILDAVHENDLKQDLLFQLIVNAKGQENDYLKKKLKEITQK